MSAAAEDIETQFARTATGMWWLPLVMGIIYLLFALLLLSVDTFTTALALGIWAGIGFLFAGLAEFANAVVVDGGKRWLHALFGVFCIGASIVAFAWPGKTILVIAAIVAWFVLFSGVFEIVFSFLDREEDAYWWLRLISGVLMVVLGFWATGYPGRSFVLLVVWIAAWAVIRGVGSIVLAFALRSAHRQLTAP